MVQSHMSMPPPPPDFLSLTHDQALISPSMLQAMALVVGKDAFKTELFSTFERLAQDECPRVRKAIACGFHEVCCDDIMCH